MASLATWYHNQYSAWNRTRRLQMPPYIARTGSNTSRAATAMTRQTGSAVNMSDFGQETDGKMNKDTLFGPSIGVVNDGPEWANMKEKNTKEDELTREVVKSWVAKSKEATQPTTTLQALVNLKRPTIRLSPLAAGTADDAEADSHLQHGLEFEFDCDAPKCGISMHVIGLPVGDSTTRMVIFEAVVEGGFGKKLKLEEGAMLDLDKLEAGAHPEAGPMEEPLHNESLAAVNVSTEKADASASHTPQRRKRLTIFKSRHHGHSRPAAGPALAIVDAEASPSAPEHKDEKDKMPGDEGVKVSIRLAAFDENGEEYASNNAQTTYLHVVHVGQPSGAEGHAEDNRPWLVKVVKREATIGPHTFHLHEIYGLSSRSHAPSQPVAPTAPTPTDSHAYPPTTPLVTTTHEDDPTSECLLCLSAPREVVLLPCRHLVACRECAINMIEFGAGGTLVHTDSEPAAPEMPATGDAATPTEPGNDAAGPAEAAAAPIVATPTPAPAPTRRKRKAKGWFCPVCRQPYTAMIRITTAAPMPKAKEIDNRLSVFTAPEDDGRPSEDVSFPPPTLALPQPVTTAQPSRGLGGMGRPGFLRHFSRGSLRQTSGTSTPAEMPASPPASAIPNSAIPMLSLPPDLERGQGTFAESQT